MAPKFVFTKLDRSSVFERFGSIDWQQIATFLDGWQSGQKGYVEIKKESRPKSRNQLAYYYAVILPQAVDAFKKNEDFSLNVEFKNKTTKLELTLNNMDYFLKFRYAALTGKYMNKSEMNMEQCSAFEDWCIKWLATWLNCQIPPADVEWREHEKDNTQKRADI